MARAIAIAAELPYAQVYDRLARGTGAQRASKRIKKRPASARNGVNTKRKWFKDYMRELGFEWTPTMLIGQGCRVHLTEGELPPGRLVVAVSKHYTAVIDGVIHDTHDPQRAPETTYWYGEAGTTASTSGGRCVYGYWSRPNACPAPAQAAPEA